MVNFCDRADIGMLATDREKRGSVCASYQTTKQSQDLTVAKNGTPTLRDHHRKNVSQKKAAKESFPEKPFPKVVVALDDIFHPRARILSFSDFGGPPEKKYPASDR